MAGRAKTWRAFALATALCATGSRTARADEDVQHVGYELTLDPAGGTTQAKVEVTTRSTAGPLAYSQLCFDASLAIKTATAAGRTVALDSQAYAPITCITASFTPPAPEGQDVTLVVEYGGTLACGETSPGASYCDVGANRVARFETGSALPFLGNASGDVATQSIILHTPSGQSVAVSAEPLARHDDGTTLTTEWAITTPSALMPVVFAGALALDPLPNLSHDVQFAHAPGDTDWLADLPATTAAVIPFLEGMADRPLPYAHVTLVKLAPYHRANGYTTEAMIVLRAEHAMVGPDEFAAEWAHEWSHFWFGLTAPPGDLATERLLTEGLARLNQIDFLTTTVHAKDDRDLYLAHRHHEAELLLRYLTNPATFPSIVVADAKDAPEYPAAGFLTHMTWAYYKTAALLDYLRVTLGETAFASGIRAYLDQCVGASCGVPQFRQVMEHASGQDLQSFFAQWVTSSTYPNVDVSFTQSPPSTEGTRVEVTLQQGPAPVTIPLELWLVRDDGTRDRHPVVLRQAAQTFTFDVTGPVRAVRPNPRADVFVWSRSAQAGDENFDGVVDGEDVLACAWQHGKEVKATYAQGGESVFGLDLRFDTRCDSDGNGVIGAEDLATQLEHFGEGKP